MRDKVFLYVWDGVRYNDETPVFRQAFNVSKDEFVLHNVSVGEEHAWVNIYVERRDRVPDKTVNELINQALEVLNQLNVECGDCFPSIDSMVEELLEFKHAQEVNERED